MHFVSTLDLPFLKLFYYIILYSRSHNLIQFRPTFHLNNVIKFQDNFLIVCTIYVNAQLTISK